MSIIWRTLNLVKSSKDSTSNLLPLLRRTIEESSFLRVYFSQKINQRFVTLTHDSYLLNVCTFWATQYGSALNKFNGYVMYWNYSQVNHISKTRMRYAFSNMDAIPKTMRRDLECILKMKSFVEGLIYNHHLVCFITDNYPLACTVTTSFPLS